MRIKSHPSLCLWGGNNEVETMFAYVNLTATVAPALNVSVPLARVATFAAVAAAVPQVAYNI